MNENIEINSHLEQPSLITNASVYQAALHTTKRRNVYLQESKQEKAKMSSSLYSLPNPFNSLVLAQKREIFFFIYL